MSTMTRRFVALVLACAWLALLAPLAAAQDEDAGRSETEILRSKVEQLEGDLAKARDRRDYYQDRTVKLKAENAALKEEIAALEGERADLEARVAELEAQDAPPPEPPQTGMTADERAYLLENRAIMADAAVTLITVADIMNAPGFSENLGEWYRAAEAMRPFHDTWSRIQTMAPPPRLAALHQASVDTLYNLDQSATLYDQALATFDVNLMFRVLDHIDAANEALDRVNREIKAYEAAANVDISEELG